MEFLLKRYKNKNIRFIVILLCLNIIFLCLGIILHVLSKEVLKLSDYPAQIQENVSKYEKEITGLFYNEAFLQKVIPSKDKLSLDKDFVDAYIDKPYTFFVYNKYDINSIWYWNNNKIYPNDIGLIIGDFYTGDASLFARDSIVNIGCNLADIQTLFIAKNHSVVENGVNKAYLLVGILPLYNNYTKKIASHLIDSRSGKYIEILEEKTFDNDAYCISNKKGEEVLYLKIKDNSFNSFWLTLANIAYLISWISMAIAAYYTACYFLERGYSFFVCCLGLTLAFVVLRIFIWQLPFPLIDNNSLFAIFQKDVLTKLKYWFSDTLGYFIIDVFLFTTVAYFIHWRLESKHVQFVSNKKIYIFLYAIFVYSLLALEFWILTNLIKHIIYDNETSFQFHNLSYLNIDNIIAITALMTLLLELLMHNYKLIKVVDHIPFSKKNKIIILSAISIPILLLQIYFGESIIIGLIEFLSFFLLVRLLYFINKNNKVSVLHIAGYIILFSSYCSIILFFATKAKADEEYKKFAKVIADERDANLEMLMDSIIVEIQNNDKVRKYYSGFLEIPPSDIETKYLIPSFFRKYEFVISYYDIDNKPYKKEMHNYLVYKNTLYSDNTIQLKNKSIYFYSSEKERYRYIVKIPINNTNNVFAGSIIIELRPIDKNIYNDIFASILSVSKSDVEIFAEKNEVALYKDDKRIWNTKNNILLGSLQGYEYPKPNTYAIDTIKNHKVLVYSNDNENIVMIVCKEYDIMYLCNIFVFVLCVSLCSLVVLWLIMISSLKIFKSFNLFIWSYQQTLTGNIQFTIIGVLLFSLILISSVTITDFNRENIIHNREQLIEKLQLSSHFISTQYFDKKKENKYPLDILDLQKITQFNVHIYDEKGMLERASTENIFDKHWLGRQMNLKAFHALNKLNNSFVIENEAIGDFEYLSAYIPLKTESGTLGYLNFIYDTASITQQQQEQDIEFLGSLLRSYAIILLVACLLGAMISKTITKKLIDISNRLKQVSLDQKNEPLKVEGVQEISHLLEHYNEMLIHLEENKQILEKTQRETAWRDMAKQVAHEIKNPLTPMKLKIQMLERLMKTDPAKAQAKFEHLSKGIVEQIDNLAAIASEFSNFAQMPPPNNEVFSINELALSTVQLFEHNEHYDINFYPYEHNILVYADKNQVLRVFNNLIKNATQAIDDERKGIINVYIDKEEDKVLIKVSDNGIGISEDIQIKLFTPYFTSKSSGTGIGLYMCKNIIMNAHGAIYFKSIEGEGSIFTVELPIHKA